MKPAPIPESLRNTTYQLDENSVSPTRMVRRDEDGNDIEETISAYPRREFFVDKAGNVCEVVLCNSRTTARNNEAIMYAQQVRSEWIRAGGLPVAECPHAPNAEYRGIIGTAVLVAAPKGEQACEGAADGCKHVKAQIAKRQAATKAAHDKQEARSATITTDQLQKMGKVFGSEIAGALGGASAAKQGLVAGRGEKD